MVVCTNRRRLLKSAATVGTIGIAGCLGAQEDGAEPVELTLSTPPDGSTPYLVFSRLAGIYEDALPEGSIVSVASGTGDWGGTNGLLEGDFELANVGSNTQHAAYSGLPPYEEEHENLRLVFGGSTELFYTIAVREDYREEHGITSLRDIIEDEIPLRFATYPGGSTGEFVLRQWLSLFDVTISDIESWGGEWHAAPPDDIVSMFGAGDIDALAHVCPPGHPVWTQLTGTHDFYYLSVGDEVLQEFEEYNYKPGTLDSSAEIWQETLQGIQDQGDVDTIRYNSSLGTTESAISDQVAYTLAKATHENSEEVAEAVPAFAAAFSEETVTDPTYLGAPLHDGAKEYWDEVGLL